MTQEQIDRLINRRNKLLERRDSLYDHKTIDRIDAQLAQVPAGERTDVDAALGRRWSTDAQRAAWQASGAAETARLAEEKQNEHDAYLESIADQYADMLDWHRFCGDLGL